jgi:hypothetical protein
MEWGSVGLVMALGGLPLYLLGYLRMKRAITRSTDVEATRRVIRSTFRSFMLLGNVFVIVGTALVTSRDWDRGVVYLDLIVSGVLLMAVGVLLFRTFDRQDVPYSYYGQISYGSLLYFVGPGIILLVIGLYIMAMLMGI